MPENPPAGSSAGEPAGQASGQPAGDGVAGDGVAGPELARAVLDAALAKRRAAPPPRRGTAGASDGRRLRGYSGPGPDPRDPQLFGAVLERLMKARGWEKPKAEATVFGAWEKVVGPDIATVIVAMLLAVAIPGAAMLLRPVLRGERRAPT